VAFGYAAAMAVGAVAARPIARVEMTAISGEPVTRLLVSPVPVNPFRRRVVAEQEEVYRTGEFRWLEDPHVDRASVRVYPKGPRGDPAVQRAASSTLGRRFLGWARFVDLRYADRPGAGFGAVSIPVGVRPHSEVTE
jgi:inner membrane protein